MKRNVIICHKYKFIFLKTSKTAGTSMEVALSRFCGDRDVITPISVDDESIRSGLGYPKSQNYFAPLSDYCPKDLVRLMVLRKKKSRFYNHISAKETKQYVGENIWTDYYKFCFERNPWDRLISFYYWRHQSEPRPTISEFIDSSAPSRLRATGFDLYTIDQEIAVDRIFLYENMQAELDRLRVILRLPETPTLPKSNSLHRKDKRHYRDILSHAEKEKVGNIFSKEIGLFGYQF